MNYLYFIFLAEHRATDWSNPSTLDLILVAFNALEALVWFGCAWFVLSRNMKGNRSTVEYIYTVLFVLFGVSDVLEMISLSSPLIWAKLVILLLLFRLRSKVIGSYGGKYKLL